MPTQADAPLRKVTLNLYASDVDEMARRYGFGWSEKVRKLVHEHLFKPKVITVGDLLTENEDGE